MSDKAYSAACERNRTPIFEVIAPRLKKCRTLLEIGSGTGQHAVYFGQKLNQLTWQTADLAENHSGICRWIKESELANVLPPIELDLLNPSWPASKFDCVYSANTAHIMPWAAVEGLLSCAAHVLGSAGQFILYGPFNYNGQFTSESNQAFDFWLKERNPDFGIRDFERVNHLAAEEGLSLLEDIEMPANNRILIWQKI